MTRILINCDDGHSCAMLMNPAATVSNIIEDYCRLRKVSDPLGPVIDPSDCILAHSVSTPETKDESKETQYLNVELKLQSLLTRTDSKKGKAGRNSVTKFDLLGFRGKKGVAAVTRMHLFASQLSTLSSVFSKTMADINGSLQGEICSLESISRKVDDRVNALKDDLLLILSGGSANDRFILDTAKDAVQAGDLDRVTAVLRGEQPVLHKSVSSNSMNGSYLSSFNPSAGPVAADLQRPKAPPATKKTPAMAATATAAFTAPATTSSVTEAPVVTSTAATKKAASKSASASAATAAAAPSALVLSVDSQATTDGTAMDVVEEPLAVVLKPVPQKAPRVTAAAAAASAAGRPTRAPSEAESKAGSAPVPVPVAAVHVQDLTKVEEDSSSSGSDSDSSSDSESGSSSSSDSESESESEVGSVRPTMVGGSFDISAATVPVAAELDVLFAEPTPFTQPIESQDETAQALQRAKLDLINRLSIGGDSEGVADMTQVSSQSSPGDEVLTDLPFAQKDDYLEPPLSQVSKLESHFSQAEPSAMTAAGAVVPSDEAGSDDSDSDSSSGSSGSGSGSSGSSDSDSGSDSSDSEEEGGGATHARLSQSAALATLSAAKTPTALQNLLIKPLARKPPSSFLSQSQQLQASQELELERQLFPKILTPGVKTSEADGSDSEDSSSSSGSDSGSSSGSESDSESSDSSDGEEEEVIAGKDTSSDAISSPVASTTPSVPVLVAAAEPAVVAPVSAKKGRGKAAATPAKKAVAKKTPTTASKSPAAVVLETAPAAVAAVSTTPAAAGKGGRGAGRAGRGAAGTPGAEGAGGRGGRGGRGGASKRRDIDPNLLRSMIAGTSTVSASSMDGGAPSNGAAAPNTPQVTATNKKRKAVSEGKMSSPAFGPTGTQVKAKKPKVVAPVVPVASIV